MGLLEARLLLQARVLGQPPNKRLKLAAPVVKGIPDDGH
jgi:hypothetical protein